MPRLPKRTTEAEIVPMVEQSALAPEPDHEPEQRAQAEYTEVREGIGTNDARTLERRAIFLWDKGGRKGAPPSTPHTDALMASRGKTKAWWHSV